MTIMYRTGWDSRKIEAYPVVKATDKTITYDAGGRTPRRENRESRDAHWHPTWEAARSFQVARAKERLRQANIQASRAKEDMEALAAMVQPTEPKGRTHRDE